MNRRQFTTSLGAAAGAASLPLRAAIAAPAATAAVAGGDSYLWASFVARVHGKVTPNVLMQMLKITPDQTGQVLAEMVHNKVINPVNAQGVFSTVNPMANTWASSGGALREGADKLAETAKDHVKQVIEQDMQEDQQIEEIVEEPEVDAKS